MVSGHRDRFQIKTPAEIGGYAWSIVTSNRFSHSVRRHFPQRAE
jgi:hypothetical protein